jgi:hypothetical protein
MTAPCLKLKFLGAILAIGAAFTLPSAVVATPPPPPPPENTDDTHIVSWNQNAASRYPACQYAYQGPSITVTIPIGRYVGEVDGDGYLADPAGLISRGLLSGKARLRLPAGDVDYGTAADWPPERDMVYINDHPLGYLTGAQQIWAYNEFEFDISWLKFPQQGSGPGVSPAPAENTLRIDIDTANDPAAHHWCVSIDWVELSFDAMAPIVLVHGVHESPAIVWFMVNQELGSEKIPHNSVSLAADGAVTDNGRDMREAVSRAAAQFGANKVHLICHSKGGLDSHWYLGNFASDNPRVLSVTTLSSPYQGSVLADLVTIQDAFPNSAFNSSDPDLRTVIRRTSVLNAMGLVAQPPGLLDLTTTAAPRLMALSHPPSSVHWASYGADADLNGDRRIAPFESLPLSIASGLCTAAYRTMGRAAGLTVTTERAPGSQIVNIEIAATNPQFFLNDLGVTAVSAHGPEGVYRATLPGNHFSTLSGSVTQEIVSRLKQEFPLGSE